MSEELVRFAIDFVDGVEVTLVDETAGWGCDYPGALFLVSSVSTGVFRARWYLQTVCAKYGKTSLEYLKHHWQT